VLKYGSDPLGTYLPDSDIDITVLCDKKQTSKCPLAQLSPLAQLKAIKKELENCSKQQEDEEERTHFDAEEV